MNLLPKEHKEFHEKEYWDNFFKKRGKKAFEWYGEYHELCGILHKYTKQTDNILQVGCGNSSLASDLYDVGYRNIRSIDISDLVIRQMSDQNKERPQLVFEKMDATDMKYSDNSYSVVLDKGTLDALFTDTSLDVVNTVEKMFSEICRVLRLGGRYICVSLLQEHILSHLVRWFSGKGWPVRIIRCQEADAAKEPQDRGMPVFVVVATKFNPSNMRPLLELSLRSESGQLTRLEDVDSLIQSVRGCQQFSALRARLAGGGDKTLAEASLDLRPAGSDTPRYSLFLAERTKKSEKSNLPFAAFIVPQGREVEWMFATAEGRSSLCESASCSRLVVIHLARNNTFTNLIQVQEELAGHVLDLAPDNLPSNYKVPFLSAGQEEVGGREERCRGHSALSGDYVVEDVTVGDQVMRRLIFLNRPHLTQSEALVKTVKVKNSKKRRKEVDNKNLASTYHGVMVGSLGLFLSSPARVLVIGLGGGSLPTYIHSTFPLTNVHVVELDPAIVRVAADQFSFQLESPRMTVSTADGITFITECQEKFDLIMLDVDSKDISSGMSCPPPDFLEPEFLQLVSGCLCEGGMFVLNLVCRDSLLRSELMSRLGQVWSSIVTYKLSEDVNEVIFASNSQKLRDTGGGQAKHKISSAFKLVNDHVRKVLKTNDDLIDIEESLDMLKISH